MTYQMDREIEALEADLAKGAITTDEYNEEMREIERDYRDAASVAADFNPNRGEAKWLRKKGN